MGGNRPDPATVGSESGAVKYELVYTSLTNGGDPFDVSRFPVQGVLRAELLPPQTPPFLTGPAGSIVSMPLSRRARFEAFPEKTAAQVSGFTAAAKIYER